MESNNKKDFYSKDYKKNVNNDSEVIDLEIEDLSFENGQIEGQVELSGDSSENDLTNDVDISKNGNADFNKENDLLDDNSSNESSDMTDLSDDKDSNVFDDRLDDNEPSVSDNNLNNNNTNEEDNPFDNNTNENTNDTDKKDKEKKDSNDEKLKDDKNVDDEQSKQNHENDKLDSDKNESKENNSKDDNNSKNNNESKNETEDSSKKKDNNSTNKSNDNNNLSNSPKESPKKNDSAIDNKRNQAKQSQGNKSPKSSGSGIKDKLKNGAKNKMQNATKNVANNSEVGQKINNAKNKIDTVKNTADATKKAGKAAAKTGKAVAKLGKTAAKGLIDLFVSTLPWSAIVVAIVILLIFIIIVLSMLTPGVGDDVNDDENLSHYSEVDQKTLSKMKERFDRYPNADGTLAMAIVLYPYFDTLQDDGTVVSILSDAKTEEDDTEEEIEDDTIIDEDDPDNNEDTEKSEDDLVSDDPYLEPFRKRKMLNRLKKVLKNIDGKNEDEIANYLKDDYFKKDSGYGDYEGDAFNGYKELFKSVNKSERDALADAIIADLKNKKDWFIDYVFLNKSCSTSYQSAGTVEIDEMLKSNILVDVKVSSCTTGSNVWNCESMYDAPITMDKYVKGVTYEEIGVSGSSDIEKVKAQMVAAKSYAIGRNKSMGWGAKKDEAGNYVITIRANTNDQDYCDIDLGCSSGKTEVRSGSRKRSAVDSATRAKLDEAWEATKNIYIYNNSKKTTAGEFCNNRSGVCNFCKKGTCLAHQELENFHATDFMSILGDQYSSYAVVTIEGEYATAQIASSTNCSNLSGSDIDDEKFIYYSQNDYPDTAFCGRSLASYSKNGCSHADSICTSGCGITSTAMVVATLTQNTSVTPETINKSVRVGTDCGNYGSNGTNLVPYMAKANGLESDSIDVSASALKAALDEGGLVVANVDGVFKGSKYGTGGGHYVVVRGYEGDYVYIADPWQNTSLKNHCKSKNKKGQCVKAYLKMDDFVTNVKNHGISGFIKVTGKIKFNQLSTTGGTGKKGEATGKLTYPVGGKAKGCNSSFPSYSGHTGIDINSSYGAKQGDPIYAADGGTVVISKDVTSGSCSKHCNNGYYSYGRYVKIDHGNGYYTLYAHLEERKVKVGDKVAAGQVIGLLGNNGNSSGPHLHFELIKNGEYLNGCKYLKKGTYK